MRAFGQKRTYGYCRTSLRHPSGKIHVKVPVKSKKAGRVLPKDED